MPGSGQLTFKGHLNIPIVWLVNSIIFSQSLLFGRKRLIAAFLTFLIPVFFDVSVRLGVLINYPLAPGQLLCH
jgi:hypothetical protein